MKVERSAWINWALLIFVNLLWAAQYPAYEVASRQIETAALNFWTFVLATALLLPVRLLWKQTTPFALQDGRSQRDIWDFLLMGVFGIVPPSVLLAWGIAHSSASNAAILSLTIPVMMTLLGALILGEKLTALRMGSLLLGVLGTLFVSINDVRNMSFSRQLLAGNLVVLIAGAGSAFYNAYGKHLLRRFRELDVLLYSYLSGGLACAGISLIFEHRPFYSIGGYTGRDWLAIVVLGLLSWGLAMVIWMWVLNRLDIGQISVSIYLLPFLGLLLSFLVLHERLRSVQLIGGAIVLASTFVLTAYDKPQAEAAAT
jgi:drug/metabolite transporter (DMT)-like permease